MSQTERARYSHMLRLTGSRVYPELLQHTTDCVLLIILVCLSREFKKKKKTQRSKKDYVNAIVDSEHPASIKHYD